MTEQLNHLVFEPHPHFGKKIGGQPAPLGYISGGQPRIPIFELMPVLKINPDTLKTFALQMGAADRMLAALKGFVDACGGNPPDWLTDEFSAAENAIAAAEGR